MQINSVKKSNEYKILNVWKEYPSIKLYQILHVAQVLEYWYESFCAWLIAFQVHERSW